MSQRSEEVRKAIYAALNVSAVTDVATGGVFYDKAPEGATLPCVIFLRAASKPVDRAFKSTIVLEDDLWIIKAISDEDSSTTLEPQTLNENILALCETAIGETLSLGGGFTAKYVVREADIPEFSNLTSSTNDIDRWVFTNGFFLNVKVS